MKKVSSLLTAVALVAGAYAVAFAGTAPGTGINGSMHDINSVAGGYQKDDFQRTCAFCHTPHNAQPNGSVPAPLWNHAPSTKQLDAYTWAAPTNQPIAFNSDPLVGPSRLCMACHDGVTAVDSHGTAGSGHNGSTPMGSSYTDGLGNTAKRFIDNLSVTHPIGFLYQDAIDARNIAGEPEIKDQNQFFIKSLGYDGTGASINVAQFDTKGRGSVTYGPKKIGDTLYGGYFTCASCHDVHNTNNATSTAALSDGHIPNYFLWAPEQGSAICLSCHIK